MVSARINLSDIQGQTSTSTLFLREFFIGDGFPRFFGDEGFSVDQEIREYGPVTSIDVNQAREAEDTQGGMVPVADCVSVFIPIELEIKFFVGPVDSGRYLVDGFHGNLL